MTYSEAEDYLLGLELFGVRLGLERMRRLVTVLGMPQRRFASIHVVGSNGKTSVAREIAALLGAHGLRAGCYTSPHLGTFRERLQIEGEAVSEEDFSAAVARAAEAAEKLDREAAEDDRVTQFEALTAAAYHELARRRVDVAVVEAGLGGRLDATNVLPSRMAVLTSVSLEHTAWLGGTEEAIAAEKLAVVPRHGTLVTGPLNSGAAAAARTVAAERQARLVAVDAPAGETFRTRNHAVARSAAEAFLGRLEPGLVRAVARSLEVPGRLETVGTDPVIVHDGAHNPGGARALAEALPEEVGERPLVLVLGALDDKDAAGVLAPLLPLADWIVLTAFRHPRALSPEALAGVAAELGRADVELAPGPREALERARSLAGPEGAVLVTGSLHLLADLRRGPGARALSAL